ncbi:MAG: beta-glucuronidase [Clostridia bacterium]|nr:beta-glucuronidase [Clostridia bacterium]
MERLFAQHACREKIELSPMWLLKTEDAGGLEKPEKALVPSVWESHPRLRNYRGRAAYTQTFTGGGNLLFRFGGVSFRAKVFLNDVLLGEHMDAFTGFSVLAKGIEEGTHTVRVAVDNRFGPDAALHVPNDYYSYGGINRPVTVERVPDIFLTALYAVPECKDGTWQVHVTVTGRNVSGEDGTCTVRLFLGDAHWEEDVRFPAGEEHSVRFTLSCPEVQVWSPETPVLYTIRACLAKDGEVTDDLIERFGFREVRILGNRILLNGQPLFLRGFNRHEELGAFGVSVPVEGMMRDLQLMRELGANCVRTCHYPNDPRFLDLCDELGMLVWEESHARGMNEEKMRNPAFMPQLRTSTREMVVQHINHPSIFIWGCLNECADDTVYGEACYREILDLLRSLDPSRPVTAALLRRPGSRIFDAPDVVSINTYPQWYHNASVREDIDDKLVEIRKKGGMGKPIIISEIGGGAIYGFHDPLGEAKWSEERQATILRTQLEAILSHEALSGVFLWQFADVRVDESWAMSRPRTMNNKGIVDEYRRPKAAYSVVRELFHSL